MPKHKFTRNVGIYFWRFSLKTCLSTLVAIFGFKTTAIAVTTNIIVDTSFVNFTSSQCDQIGRFIALLGNFSKHMATFILPKLPTFFGNSHKGVKIIFGVTFIDIW